MYYSILLQKGCRERIHSDLEFQTLGDIRTLPFNEKVALLKIMSNPELRSAAGWTFKTFKKEVKVRKQWLMYLRCFCAVLATNPDPKLSSMKREPYSGGIEMIVPNELFVSFVSYNCVI